MGRSAISNKQNFIFGLSCMGTPTCFSTLIQRECFCNFQFAFPEAYAVLKWDQLLKERICSHRRTYSFL